MNDIDLSVIIPVYNTEKYFNKCINSVINAINKLNENSEIIVINDGSKGNIEELIKDYLEKYSNIIKFVSQENKGRGATRNKGIELARGKYINFIDSDDYIDENMYLKMFEYIRKENSDMVLCDFENIDFNNPEKNGIIEAKSKDINDTKWGVFNELVVPSCCNKIIKKELFKGISFPEEFNYEDLATIPVLVLKANKISYIDETLYKYVQNGDSVMHEEFGVTQLKLINALEVICNRIYELSNLSDNEKEKAVYMISTRRYYEKILEKIVLSDNKDILVKEFLNKVKSFENMLYNNKYFRKQISIQGFKKEIGNKLLHIAIQRNSLKLLKNLFIKKLYYKFIAVRYTNVEVNQGGT